MRTTSNDGRLGYTFAGSLTGSAWCGLRDGRRCNCGGGRRNLQSPKRKLTHVAQQRFITLTDVAEILGISGVQARALVTSGELRAIQVGGRGQWRIEQDVLEQYIQERYRATEKALEEKNRKKAEK